MVAGLAHAPSSTYATPKRAGNVGDFVELLHLKLKRRSSLRHTQLGELREPVQEFLGRYRRANVFCVLFIAHIDATAAPKIDLSLTRPGLRARRWNPASVPGQTSRWRSGRQEQRRSQCGAVPLRKICPPVQQRIRAGLCPPACAQVALQVAGQCCGEGSACCGALEAPEHDRVQVSAASVRARLCCVGPRRADQEQARWLGRSMRTVAIASSSAWRRAGLDLVRPSRSTVRTAQSSE